MAIALSEKFKEILTQLETNVPGVEATAIFDMDGLVIASRLPTGVDDEIIGAMSAAILSIGNRSGEELDRGTMKRIFVEGDNGSIVIISVGEDIVLVALVGIEVKLGLLFFECKRCISKILDIS
jgi:predicted regulator of Ras-like GTPase activity (Roadblock/LC7/MglB family)